MKARFSFVFFLLGCSAFAAVQMPVAWPGIKRTVTLTVTIPPQTFVPIPPQPPLPPVTIVAGTRVQFTTAFDPAQHGSLKVSWAKDGRAIGEGLIYEIPSASLSDTGIYSAFVTTGDAQGRTLQYYPQAAAVLITNEGQRLLNTSTRAHLDANNPAILHGFVVEPAPTPVLLLIRAVGPTLGTFGVTDPLARPVLQVFDGAGQLVGTDPTHFEPGGVLPPLDDATRRAGAFPLASGSADVARLYFLPSGPYTVSATSSDGGPGTVLVEVYRVPFVTPLTWWSMPP